MPTSFAAVEHRESHDAVLLHDAHCRAAISVGVVVFGVRVMDSVTGISRKWRSFP